jgi:predicted AlkP superfamily phosphohydrolase/phosphomutase
MVVSDHGAIGFNKVKKIYKVLEDAGLITYLNPESRKGHRNLDVDWSKTKAYSIGCCHVNVNLKGREPTGIVEPCDYDKTVDEIIRAIQNGMTTEDGKTATAFCVEKSQAGFVGHGGENCGDVVYGIIGSSLGGSFGEVHSVQIPSARTKSGDIRALCMMSGPAFLENVQIERPIDLYDFAPTLCYAMGYPQPKDATGGVIFQALKENKGKSEKL